MTLYFISLMLRSLAACAAAVLVTVLPAKGSGQMPGMPGMSHGDHRETAAKVSAKARKQIDSVAKAVSAFGTTNAASSSGYRPIFGWIPTMGVHWVAGGQMMNGRQANLKSPSQLMFSRINGRDSLVGAAYAYFTAMADTIRPSVFDGSPAWHEHKDLAPPGGTLVMLHVWFVPSPDGPFAGTNPNLPFWALGLAAPDSARMRNARFKDRVYRASLALSEVVDSSFLFPHLEERADVQAVLGPRRDSIRALVPELLAAQEAKDAARWDRAIDRAAAQWDAIYKAYVATTRTKAGRERVEQTVQMLLGKHQE
jgi:hypothetical protein